MRRRLVAMSAALIVGAVVLAACKPVPPSKPIPKSQRSVYLPFPPRTEVAGAYWSKYKKIVVAGGFVPNNAGTGNPTTSVFSFNVLTKKWSTGPALPSVRDHANLAVLDDTLYLVGGFKNSIATKEVWSLASPGAAWTQQSDLNVARGAPATVAVSGHLLVLGGTDNADPALKSTEVYDPAANTWALGPPLKVGRQHTGAAVVGKKVFAIAGRPPNLTSVESIIVNPSGPMGSWKNEPSLNFSRGGNGAAAVAGVPCTAGGEQAGGTIASIECLRAGRWQHVANLTVPRHGLALVGVGRRLHIISGGDRPGFAFTSTHEVLDL